MYVYFYLFTRAGLARLDAAFLEAAAALGAGPLAGSLRRVTLPLLRPALAGAALLTFMTSLASFSAPYLFGGDVPRDDDADRLLALERRHRASDGRDRGARGHRPGRARLPAEERRSGATWPAPCAARRRRDARLRRGALVAALGWVARRDPAPAARRCSC